MSYRRPRFPEDHFLRLPNAWARDGNLKPNAKAMLMSILSHDPEYALSTAQLMRETGLGRDAIQAATRHMLERGYVTEVEQTRDDGTGRWGGNDYLVTECVGVPTPPTVTADPDKSGQNVRIDPLRDEPVPGEPVPASTARKKTPGEKNTPVPTEQGGQLRLIGGEPELTVNQRAKVISDEHYEACGKLENWNAVNALVRKALGTGRTDEAVRAALTFLRDSHRTVTGPALRGALDSPVNGPRNVGRGSYRPPYQNPDPATHPDAFSGSF